MIEDRRNGEINHDKEYGEVYDALWRTVVEAQGERVKKPIARHEANMGYVSE